MTEREAFERVATIIGFQLSRNSGGEYESVETKLVWQGWTLRADIQAVSDSQALVMRCKEIQNILDRDK